MWTMMESFGQFNARRQGATVLFINTVGNKYENSTVHEDWHCFQTFAEWYYKELSDLKWNGKSYLDKDVLGDGRIYSERFCCIVPFAIHTIIA